MVGRPVFAYRVIGDCVIVRLTPIPRSFSVLSLNPHDNRPSPLMFELPQVIFDPPYHGITVRTERNGGQALGSPQCLSSISSTVGPSRYKRFGFVGSIAIVPNPGDRRV